MLSYPVILNCRPLFNLIFGDSNKHIKEKFLSGIVPERNFLPPVLCFPESENVNEL